MSKTKAFTLAEVLITLLVIGVIAAVTIPTLLHHYKKTEVQTALKKFYSSMTNAIMLSEVENGPSEDWTMGENLLMGKKPDDFEEDELKDSISKQRQGVLSYYNEYLAKYLNTLKIETEPESWFDESGLEHRGGILVKSLDGVDIMITQGGCMNFFADVNGDKKPNQFGKDRFSFFICDKAHKGSICFSDKERVCTYAISDCKRSREECIEKCATYGHTCSALLQLDGFKFKDDYPFKL